MAAYTYFRTCSNGVYTLEYSSVRGRTYYSSTAVNLVLSMVYLFWYSSLTYGRTVLLSRAKSWTLYLLAFDEYCRFDTSAFFMRIKRAWLYTNKESRSIKTEIFIER